MFDDLLSGRGDPWDDKQRRKHAAEVQTRNTYKFTEQLQQLSNCDDSVVGRRFTVVVFCRDDADQTSPATRELLRGLGLGSWSQDPVTPYPKRIIQTMLHGRHYAICSDIVARSGKRFSQTYVWQPIL